MPAETTRKRKNALTQRDATAIATFNCPTRRQAIAYPMLISGQVANGYLSPMVARTDYAANQGDLQPLEIYVFPPSLHGHFNWPISTTGDAVPPYSQSNNGINFMNAYLRPVDVMDGLSHTYMVGEKYLCPDEYRTGTGPADDWGMYCGDQNDTNRLCTNDPSGSHQPMRDRPGFGGWSENFGSPHAASFNMVMCDGSVQSVRYDVDPVVHSRLGNRKDRLPVDMTRL